MTKSISLKLAIERVARELMHELCQFEGVSGDFDRCVSTTRQVYEAKAAQIFGCTLDDYYAMCEELDFADQH